MVVSPSSKAEAALVPGPGGGCGSFLSKLACSRLQKPAADCHTGSIAPDTAPPRIGHTNPKQSAEASYALCSASTAPHQNFTAPHGAMTAPRLFKCRKTFKSIYNNSSSLASVCRLLLAKPIHMFGLGCGGRCHCSLICGQVGQLSPNLLQNGCRNIPKPEGALARNGRLECYNVGENPTVVRRAIVRSPKPLGSGLRNYVSKASHSANSRVV